MGVLRLFEGVEVIKGGEKGSEFWFAAVEKCSGVKESRKNRNQQ